MSEFSVLRAGQWVKVKGSVENGHLLAHEIKIRPADDRSAMESKLQKVDPDSQAITLMNVAISVGSDVEIKNADREQVSITDLKVGEIVKLKGAYNPDEGFKPEKVKLQESKGVDYDELQGFIDGLDKDAASIEVLGVKVAVNESTEIEGF